MKKNKIWNIITHYHWESAFFKHCFRWFLIVLIPTFIIGLCISIFTWFVTNKNIQQSNEFSFHTINEQTNDIFDKINDFHYSFSNNYNVLKFCLSMTENNNDLSITITNVHSLISTFSSTHDNIHSIYLYNPSINRVIGNNYSSTLSEFYDAEWISNNNIPDAVAIRNYYDSNVISIKRSMVSDANKSATIIYNIDLDSFSNSFVSNSSVPVISFLSEDKEVLYSSRDIKNERVTGTYNAIIPNNLRLEVAFLPAHSDIIQIMSFWVFWIAFIILIIVDVVFSYKLALNYFKLVVENIMQFQSLYTYNEESEKLLEELNLMIHSPIKKTEKKDVEHFLINQYRQLNSSRITSLQEQINPHFIFNTLNLISLLEMEQDSSSGLISKITRHLSDILRYSIETSSNMVSFADEIMYLDKYMEIQNIKYEGKFTFEKNYDAEINDCTIIKFILQPIVENAIIHGILNSPQKRGTISVTAKNINDTLIIDISNTGAKIPVHRLDSLNTTLSTYVDSDGRHIGLINVNNRIKLLFGEKYGVYITSDDNLTTVTLTMPYIQ